MENIIIPNPDVLNEKLKNITKDGPEKLHILSDFDRTLTKAFYKSKKASSIISYLRKDKGRYLTKDYAEKAMNLFNKFHPIEINPNISKEEKSKKMYEWWKAHKELLIQSGFDKKLIQQSVKDMIKENSLMFRDNSNEFFELLKLNKIPLIIMSSSLEDLIKEFIKQKNIYSDNIHVIANKFEFNEKGKAISIKRIIHVFNKHEMELSKLSIYQELLKRKNIILLGDSLGDLGMSHGFPFDEIIKIGFLNENIEQNLESYKKHFDIIILNDGSIEYITNLLKKILKSF